MGQTGCLEGKVVVVTGAGRGIGRAIALLAANEGARVLVNDLGGSADGDGSDAEPATQVVAEIVASGGAAHANVDSVATPKGAEQIIADAVQKFGRVDAIVNNAGILRDAIFHRMSSVAFEDVVKVNLFGSFYVARAAAPHFREQGGGAYVHLVSASGLIGNLGQANYSAAKLGVAGLSKSIALDMARFGVRSNCIAPFAWSRLIGTLSEDTPEEKLRVERFRSMTPDKVAPLAVFLASSLSEGVTGQIFASRNNEIFLMSQPRPIRSVHHSEGWTAQRLAERMLPAFKADLYGLDRSADVFSWDPI